VLPPFSCDGPVSVDLRSPAERRLAALEAARVSAVRLADSVLSTLGLKTRLFYDLGPHPTLDPAPVMFETPAEEKASAEKREVRLSQAWQAWAASIGLL